MRSTVDRVRVRGIVCGVPQEVVLNSQFHEQFGIPRVTATEAAIGVLQRRLAAPGDSLLTLAIPAVRRLQQALSWYSVDALVVVTQTPVQPGPATAILLQHEIQPGKPCVAFDVNLGCSGYPYGLWLLGRLLTSGQRGFLVAGDLCTRYLDPQDHATSMLFGDAVSVTALEGYDPQPEIGTSWRLVAGSDGGGAPALRLEVPTAQDALPLRSSVLRMRGAEVFSFTLRAVPELYRQLVEGLLPPQRVVLHQANRMIVERLSAKIGYPPILNVDQFGNTSAASIPLALCTELQHELKEKSLYLALLGFGIGWSWAGLLLSMGPLECAEVVIV